MNKTKSLIIISLLIALFGSWAFSPLWFNPCIPTHLTEEEIKHFREEFGSKYITQEEQARNDQRYREEEIPCGAQGLSIPEKIQTANWTGRILGELGFLSKLLILRFEMVDTNEDEGVYYFKAYTFFYIPLYRVFAGGSGYMEIDMIPFEDDGLKIGEWK